jgi:hypothetical protein
MAKKLLKEEQDQSRFNPHTETKLKINEIKFLVKFFFCRFSE